MSVKSEWGLECPRCHNDAFLFVEVKTMAALSENGTDCDTGDHEWDEDSRCECAACDWQGTVKDATVADDKKE